MLAIALLCLRFFPCLDIESVRNCTSGIFETCPGWLQNIGGGPDIFADMLETEYRLNNEFGMTFGMADQEYRKQLEAQRSLAVTLLIAPAIGSLADRMVNGSAKGAYANNAYDNLERYGTKESQSPWKQPEVEGDFIDGIRISVGKVGGKIPVDEFKVIRQYTLYR